MFISVLFIISQTREQPKRPSKGERIIKLWYLYILEYYSAMKKNELFIDSHNDMDRFQMHFAK